MYTITDLWQSDYRIRGSKFLGFLSPCEAKDDVNEFLENIKNDHPTATHHCYAYRTDPNHVNEFDQDDGEPSGSAGMPILNTMRSAEMINAILVVVRYYGGTKLGKSGLIDAYGQSAKLAIENADLKRVTPIKTYRIVYDYPHQGIIDQLKNQFTWIELNSTYLEKADLLFGCPLQEINRLEGKLNSVRHLFGTFKTEGFSHHIENKD